MNERWADAMLAGEQIENFRRDGQLTVRDLFSAEQIDGALADLTEWDAEFRATLTDEQREWYLEDPSDPASPFRKLDNPVFHRAAFRELATAQALVESVEQLIGPGVTLFFSQVFCKPPEVGGPKPVHQDNFYFAPSDTDALLTTWIALDAATEENGCLHYGHGSHREPVLEHNAPEAEPFNLQVSAEVATKYPMTPAPVPRCGVSIHHGNTLHQSSANRSNHPRRAVTFHFLKNDAQLVNPALDYEPSNVVKISLHLLSTGQNSPVGQTQADAALLAHHIFAAAGCRGCCAGFQPGCVADFLGQLFQVPRSGCQRS